MRDSSIRSTTFQTKTEASGEKITQDRVVDEVPQRFQTRAIGLVGRKPESFEPNLARRKVELALAHALKVWIGNGDASALRSELLKLLLQIDGQ